MGNEPWPIGVCPCPNGSRNKKNTFFFIFKPADGNDSSYSFIYYFFFKR